MAISSDGYSASHFHEFFLNVEGTPKDTTGKPKGSSVKGIGTAPSGFSHEHYQVSSTSLGCVLFNHILHLDDQLTILG